MTMLAAQPTPTPSPTPTQAPAVTHLSFGTTALIVSLVVAFVVAAGLVIGLTRWWLEGSARNPPRGQRGVSGVEENDRTIVRSWLAIALIGGLLIFCAVSFALDDSTLRSSLMGGVIASAGAASAFYFASKSSDQARKDILNASLQKATIPKLVGMHKSDVVTALAGSVFTLNSVPLAAKNEWIATEQDPQPNNSAGIGTEISVTFAGAIPRVAQMTFADATKALADVNLNLIADPAAPGTAMQAQAPSTPPEGSDPPPDRNVQVRFTS
jgi:hypothetical protein